MALNQLTVFVANEQGALVSITDALAAANIDIRALSIADTKDFGILRLIVDGNDTALKALEEKGYNSINQIVGYILSEDPTYITNYKDARALVRKLDRDELLRELVRSYLTK